MKCVFSLGAEFQSNEHIYIYCTSRRFFFGQPATQSHHSNFCKVWIKNGVHGKAAEKFTVRLKDSKLYKEGNMDRKDVPQLQNQAVRGHYVTFLSFPIPTTIRTQNHLSTTYYLALMIIFFGLMIVANLSVPKS